MGSNHKEGQSPIPLIPSGNVMRKLTRTKTARTLIIAVTTEVAIVTVLQVSVLTVRPLMVVRIKFKTLTLAIKRLRK